MPYESELCRVRDQWEKVLRELGALAACSGIDAAGEGEDELMGELDRLESRMREVRRLACLHRDGGAAM